MTGSPSSEDFDRWLEACRERFGEPPRRFGLLATWFTHWVPPPKGLRFADDLSLFFHFRPELLRTGVVVWGHLLRGDDRLSETGPDDRPATAVFCPLPGGGPTVPELGQVAAKLIALSEATGLRPDAQGVADCLADEHTRPFGLRVPVELAGRHPSEVSTIFVARKHLPGRRLARPYFPLVVPPGAPRVAMILPACYWPPELVSHWTEPPL